MGEAGQRSGDALGDRRARSRRRLAVLGVAAIVAVGGTYLTVERLLEAGLVAASIVAALIAARLALSLASPGAPAATAPTATARPPAPGRAVAPLGAASAAPTPAASAAPVFPASAPPAAPNRCECGAALVVRARRGDGERFLGCSTFPSCRHTRPLPAAWADAS